MIADPALDALLAELVAEQRRILSGNFVGTYLVGSFALGAADEWSDVDFLTVVESPLSDRERRELDALHARLFAHETNWAKHLEGSYAPRAQVRRKTGDEWWFLDNGSTQLVPDTHCNLWAVRWVTRERGITLDGPAPAELLDEVPAAGIREEARTALVDYARWTLEPQDWMPSGMNRWKQVYAVLTLCRVLYTAEHGVVTSKQHAGEWARERLPEWRTLIDAALADRPDPVARWYSDAEPTVVARTREFARALL